MLYLEKKKNGKDVDLKKIENLEARKKIKMGGVKKHDRKPRRRDEERNEKTKVELKYVCLVLGSVR